MCRKAATPKGKDVIEGNHDRGLAIAAMLAAPSLALVAAVVDGVAAMVSLALGAFSAFGWALLVDRAPRREARGRPIATPPRVVVPFVVMQRSKAGEITAPSLRLLLPQPSAVDHVTDRA